MMIWLLFSFFMVGAIIGSLLNVIIDRYPIMLQREWNNDCLAQLNQPIPATSTRFNLFLPRSHCAQCKTTIPFFYNIPILSFLWLRGRCAFCHTRIPVQIILVEILSAVLSVIIFLKFGFTGQCAALLFFTFGLITLSFIDINHQFLPDPITYSLLWLGLIISTQHFFISPAQSIIGAFVGYLFLWMIAKIYLFARKKEGMGLGDCKMLAMIGAWVGAISLLNVLLLSTLLALFISIILLLFKKIEHTKPIPFGPYIAIAGWCTMLYGDQITQGLVRWLQ